jgi:ATP-dependent DNA helicase RecG
MKKKSKGLRTGGGLPINIEELIHRRIIENDRLEFKAGWDQYIKKSTIRSVCAFANDLLNNNGGYIILGIDESEDGTPLLPPRGLEGLNADQVQREIIGACKASISPAYIPLIFVETFMEKTIIIIWCPAGENRPYESPLRKGEGKVYWVRSGSSSIEAADDIRRQLLEQTAKIPFDDRRSLTGKFEDISFSLVIRFLADIRSELATMKLSAEETYEKMHIIVPVNGYKVPRNAALMFFNENPEHFFNGARIEVVEFPGGAAGDLIEERAFRGPFPKQIESCLIYLEGLCGTIIHKIPGRAEAEHIVPYPIIAVKEAVVNAIYHRSYDSQREPVKVYIYPDRMEITSYPGPVHGIRKEHLQTGNLPAVPARNRRIGELLKDLKLAEARGTGIPKIQAKMKENGSPQAIFDFDDSRTYFRVVLPVNPRFMEIKKNNRFYGEGGHKNDQYTAAAGIDIKVDLPAFERDFHRLKEALERDPAADPKLEMELEKIVDAMDGLNLEAKKKELVRSFKKLGRFLKKLDDVNSGYNAVLEGTEGGMELARQVVQAYNKFARWLALPQLPGIFPGNG